MITIRMFDKWTINIPDKYIAEDDKRSVISSYIAQVVQHANYVAKNIYCYKSVIEHCNGVKTVADYMVGAGIMSTLIEEIIKPSQHYTSDIDDNCIAFVNDMIVPKYSAMQPCEKCDLFAMSEIIKHDLVSVDFGLSYGRLINDKHYRAVLDNIAAGGSKYIHMSDKTIAYFYVNKAKYANYPFKVDTIEDYLWGLSNYFNGHYGYHLSFVVGHKSCLHLLFEAGKVVTPFDYEIVTHTPDVVIEQV